MAWKDLAAGLGTSALVSELKAIESQVSKRQYKRLLSTTLARLLALDPDTKKARARRWARKAIGVKPSRKALKRATAAGTREIVEAAAVAAVGAGAAKIAGKVAPQIGRAASKAAERVKAAVDGNAADE